MHASHTRRRYVDVEVSLPWHGGRKKSFHPQRLGSCSLCGEESVVNGEIPSGWRGTAFHHVLDQVWIDGREEFIDMVMVHGSRSHGLLKLKSLIQNIWPSLGAEVGDSLGLVAGVLGGNQFRFTPGNITGIRLSRIRRDLVVEE